MGRFTNSDIKFVTEEYHYLKNDVIIDELGININQLYQLSFRLGLGKPEHKQYSKAYQNNLENEDKPWSEEEENWIKENEEIVTLRGMASTLGRTRNAVMWKKWELNGKGEGKPTP